ncbi:MAG: hypothetical protein NTX53_21000 [candidate division WOR-3 bacterium]|nr:hypothetical protein [candidate division WOR-3 bacterium]
MEKADKQEMEKQENTITFKVGFEGKCGDELALSVYVFSSREELIASAPVKDNQARLKLTPEQLAHSRVFFAPTITDRRPSPPTPAMMERLQAYEPAIKYEPRRTIYELLPFPEKLWKWWLWCRCRVRGKVAKPVDISGVVQDMPVCHARVHICEVDRWPLIIFRIPDKIIWRLRDELLRIPELIVRKPWPEPDPPFRYDPGVIDPSPYNIAKMVMRQGAPAPGAEVMINPQPLPPKEQQFARVQQTFTLPAEVQSALLSPSLEVVREALTKNFVLIRPWLCWWPWLWPYFYSCDEVAVVETNQQGRFETDVWYLCFGDHPDLYFWVEYCIGGVWTTVYHPPIRCNTYWDYVCGSEVVLRVTDPRVPWCGEPEHLPGKQVAVMLIGNNVSLHQIQGAAAGANEGLTTDGRPFGASLEPHVWFGEDLIGAGVDHYRWSYRRLGSVGDWTPLDRHVIRHYAVIDPTPPDFPLTFLPFTLGPDPDAPFVGKNLFKIQPKNAPAGSYGWAPMIDARENTASAFFLSHLLESSDPADAAGRYELKLELFDSAANLVNITNAGILLKVPTIDGPFGVGAVPTAAPAPEHLILDGAGKTVAFRLVLHVDNNPCQAEIYETTVGAASAGPCGFIEYPAGSSAHISFLAKHPNDFATFSFNTYRGSTGALLIACASGSVGASPLNGFVRNMASVFAKDVLVADLITGCPGGRAAFAETLHLDALATDGWSILDYLDRDAVPKAFALTPAPVAVAVVAPSA